MCPGSPASSILDGIFIFNEIYSHKHVSIHFCEKLISIR